MTERDLFCHTLELWGIAVLTKASKRYTTDGCVVSFVTKHTNINDVDSDKSSYVCVNSDSVGGSHSMLLFTTYNNPNRE